uniref:Family with sequence similarity 120B n=1 Tax=Eptatretus burgeri TaxID=7764 RepID=A0A8C4QX30_EPTBU
MGVLGLMTFMNNCPGGCEKVSLHELATCRRGAGVGAGVRPGVGAGVRRMAVDAPSMVRTWYTPEAWVQGGQWKEYMASLSRFLKALHNAHLHPVFFFDEGITQMKLQKWVQRRLKNGQEISEIFKYVRHTGQQPGRKMFTIPTCLCTFSKLALRSLGAEVVICLGECDKEVARYAKDMDCIGILSADSDFLIYDTVPLLSAHKLNMDDMSTVMYSREALCRQLGLAVSDLPVLACLVGNDHVSFDELQVFRTRCVGNYRGCRADVIIPRVAQHVSHLPHEHDALKSIERSCFPMRSQGVLCDAVAEYLLPGQCTPWLDCTTDRSEADVESPLCDDANLLQLVQEKTSAGQMNFVHHVLFTGKVEWSNALEDPDEASLPPTALIYRLVRQHIYSLVLGARSVEEASMKPKVKEWMVYHGNSLNEPHLISAVPLTLPGVPLDMYGLWQSEDMSDRKMQAFLACFDLADMFQIFKSLQPAHLALCCLLRYCVTKVPGLCLADIQALLAQALCLSSMDAKDLADLPGSPVAPRAVHLGSMFVRGLYMLLAVNAACGEPFEQEGLMPWMLFDGKLFQLKYHQAHNSSSPTALLKTKEQLQIFGNLFEMCTSAPLRDNDSDKTCWRSWATRTS